MTREELIEKVNSVRMTKQPCKLTKRQLVNALGCKKRTPGNVIHINEFLENYQLRTIPSYIDGWIDEEIELVYRYRIPSDSFKIYSIHITSKYKNLKNIEIDFESTGNYSAFIGLNGSGKSNVLEAISAIFYSLYHIATLKDGIKTYQCPFEYKISYILNGEYYEIINGKQRNDDKVTNNMLPKNIITSYSGEDTRLWEKHYRLIYERFCSRLTGDTQGFAPPFMFYINKEQWEIAMLVLLYSEDIDVKEFINSILKEKKATISFEYLKKNFYKWEGTDTAAFIAKIKEQNDYSIEEFRNKINEISFIEQSSTLFYYLYRSTIGNETKLISKINIKFDDGSDLEGLSEGEKKMILANTIIHILATKDSLCLFDEPDSHIHISRKAELIKLIDNSQRYSIVTTHSPVFLDKMKFENVKYLNNGKIISTEKLKQISELSSGDISFMEGAFILSSPYTVVVEGTFDIKYIKKAIDIFSRKDEKYKPLNTLAFIPMGSAGNTQSFFDDVIVNQLSNLKRLLYVFDYDDAGCKGYKVVESLKRTNSKIGAIYYQSDYAIPLDSNFDKNHTFYIEDMFDPRCYKDIIDDLHSKTKYLEYKLVNEKTCNKIKNNIEKKYKTMDDNFYNGFEPFLDKLLTVFFTATT